MFNVNQTAIESDYLIWLSNWQL